MGYDYSFNEEEDDDEVVDFAGVSEQSQVRAETSSPEHEPDPEPEFDESDRDPPQPQARPRQGARTTTARRPMPRRRSAQRLAADEPATAPSVWRERLPWLLIGAVGGAGALWVWQRWSGEIGLVKRIGRMLS